MARRRGWLIGGRLLAAVIALTLVAVVGLAWGARRSWDADLAQNSVDALVPDDPALLQPEAAAPSGPDGTGASAAPGTAKVGPTPAAPVDPADQARLPAENILILGLDTRDDSGGGVGPGTSQSDVIMVAHLHAGHQTMSVLSFPRDLGVTAPPCNTWDNSTGKVSDTMFTSPFSKWKITNTYSVGGPKCTVKAIQALTGLRIDRLIALQFTGFAAVVDSLGGVKMTFGAPVIDRFQGKVIPTAGSQIVTGAQALSLVRSRTVEGESDGDLGRIGRQQQLIKAIMAQVSSSGMLTDPGKLNKTLNVFIKNSTTANINTDDLLNLASRLGSGSVRFATVPTSSGAGEQMALAGNALPMFAALRADQPIS